jgi:hypothetical protein
LLNDLISAGLGDIVTLKGVAARHFEDLVIGSAVATLDDGEAATIAHALANEGIAVIDERKANRICASRFPDLRVASTVDILTHPDVLRDLGRDKLADAVFNALHDGRMRVFPQHLEWVVGLIGPSRAAKCNSLASSVRGQSPGTGDE